ncbi:MAG: DUF711 family protein [Thermoplasmatota archaeon]
MRIRTLTAGLRFIPGHMEEAIGNSAEVLKELKDAYEGSGIEVQTVRLSTDVWGAQKEEDIRSIIANVRELEKMARSSGIDFVSIGPAATTDAIALIPSIIEATSITCASALTADTSGRPLPGNILEAARAVKAISTIAKDGSKNFMFASIARCPEDIPFFPASYHRNDDPSLTIGLENGDIVMEAVERASSLEETGRMLVHLYEKELEGIDEVLRSSIGDGRIKSMDLSLAPGLEESASIALAVQKMIDAPFGSQGTLSACSSLTSSLRSVKYRPGGYSGLMLPVLEDEGLGRCADLGDLEVQKLLLYSAVCGTGLDAVPLPGDSPITKLASTILDMSSLAVKLDKPLSARLLPIPGKGPGEMTGLSSPYLRNCSILELR